MAKVSIIIPSRAEKPENLSRTLKSIYENATGDFEVIIGINGGEVLMKPDYPNLTVIQFPRNVGIKTNLNALAATAEGKYLFKLDAHTRVSKGFDEALQRNMEENWIVTPRFKIIKDDWSLQTRNGEEEFYDYFYLCCPFNDPKGLRFKAGGHWAERTKERVVSEPFLDKTPQIHGSAWFITKERFFWLGGFPNIDPYGHGQEPLWLGLKNWIEGGAVMVNKTVWYAHLHQNSADRGYSEDKYETEKTYRITAKYWLKHPKFERFVDFFMPMPGWPEDWKVLYQEWLKKEYK